MESCKHFSQAFISSNLLAETESPRDHHSSFNSVNPNALKTLTSLNGCIGSLEIFIHHARDIQNICIYHKQDVYAKLSLTSDPEFFIPTKIINGGGQNPIFNDVAHFNVQTINSFLKCEIWMLSRAKNYLGDQLLGSVLIPLSEIIVGKNESTREFVLSSNDIFHSPAGFVQLTLSYIGSSPEVVPATSLIEEDGLKDECATSEYAKIEFPDPNVASEDKMMVSEYFGVPCTNNIDSLNSSNYHNAGVKIVESFSMEASHDLIDPIRDETPLSCISTDASPAMAAALTEVSDSGCISLPKKQIVKPLIEVDMKPEQPVVQQEIVEMYMKSMQEFTESLANMKLPMEIGSNSGNGESGNKTPRWNNGSGGRVFYGSRAFF